MYPLHSIRGLSVWHPPISSGIGKPLSQSRLFLSKSKAPQESHDALKVYLNNWHDVLHEANASFRSITAVMLDHKGISMRDYQTAFMHMNDAISDFTRKVPNPNYLPLAKAPDAKRNLDQKLHPHYEQIIISEVAQFITEANTLAAHVANTSERDANVIRLLAQTGERPIRAFLKNKGNFNKRGTLMPINVNDIANEIYTVRSRTMSGLKIVFSPTPSTLNVFCDPDLLYIAIDNLIRNARDASKEDNTFCEIKTQKEVRHGISGVRVEIYDEGPGIEPGLRKDNKVLQRGVSTRGEGRGLGLDIFRKVITGANGKIDLIDSKTKDEIGLDEHTYTRFSFWLPEIL